MKTPSQARVLVLSALLFAPALQAQTDPAIQRIREHTGVSENRAAERLVQEDAEAEAAVERGEQPPEEAPVTPEPLPRGDIVVGTVSDAPLEEGEEPDPAADAEDASRDD